MESLKEHGGRLLEAVADYSEASMELVALKAADKSARLASNFLTIVILVLFLIFFLNMISIGLAVLISVSLDKPWVGFFIVGTFYLVTGIALYALRKKLIFPLLLNAIVDSLVGAALKAENKIEEVQDKLEDKLNLEKQPD